MLSGDEAAIHDLIPAFGISVIELSDGIRGYLATIDIDKGASS